jgi:hypothetical protein
MNSDCGPGCALQPADLEKTIGELQKTAMVPFGLAIALVWSAMFLIG